MPKRDPDSIFHPAKKRDVPFDFVLAELEELDPTTRPMFGSTGVYIGDRMVVMLRDKDKDSDDGVWVATSDVAHVPSLRKELRSMRDIRIFGGSMAKWQVLPKDHDDFEEDALRVCKLIRAGDPRIGTIPKSKKPKAPKKPKKPKAASPVKKKAAPATKKKKRAR